MAKVITGFTVVFLLASIAAAGAGAAIDGHARQADMPADIVFEIRLSGVWPDRYYVTFYDMPAPRSVSADSYWTFEPSHYPLSPPVWVHHLNALELKDTDYTVVMVTR